MDRIFTCGVVDAWEEDIWLDRRERACGTQPAAHGGGTWERLTGRVRRFRARMQMGPVAESDGRDDEPRRWI